MAGCLSAPSLPSSDCWRMISLTTDHQTSPENAKKILEANAMQPGSRNTYAGAGMYFAATPEATY